MIWILLNTTQLLVGPLSKHCVPIKLGFKRKKAIADQEESQISTKQFKLFTLYLQLIFAQTFKSRQ